VDDVGAVDDVDEPDVVGLDVVGLDVVGLDVVGLDVVGLDVVDAGCASPHATPMRSSAAESAAIRNRGRRPFMADPPVGGPHPHDKLAPLRGARKGRRSSLATAPENDGDPGTVTRRPGSWPRPVETSAPPRYPSRIGTGSSSVSEP
jgi:hypothetical protein